MSAKSNETVPVSADTNTPKITLEELVIDVSAFLHFLTEHYDGEKQSELPSFWMLIPKSLDVEWREGTKEFYLEKEIFSRKILIVAEPVAEDERQKKRAELLIMFQNSIAEDQAKQIILLLSRLKEESRRKIVESFKRFKNDRES